MIKRCMMLLTLALCVALIFVACSAEEAEENEEEPGDSLIDTLKKAMPESDSNDVGSEQPGDSIIDTLKKAKEADKKTTK